MAINALRQTPAVVRLTVLRDESQFKDEGMLRMSLCNTSVDKQFEDLIVFTLKYTPYP